MQSTTQAAVARPSILPLIIAALVSLASGCSTSSPDRVQPASGEELDLVLRFVIDGETADGHPVFLRIPVQPSGYDLEILEREWEESNEELYGLLRESDGTWWALLSQANPGSTAPSHVAPSREVVGFSDEQFYTVRGSLCDRCPYEFRIALDSTEGLPPRSENTWEHVPQRWLSASFNYDRREYDRLLEQGLTEADEVHIHLPVYTIAIGGADAEVSLALEPFFTSPSYLYTDEQCREENFDVIHGERRIPPGCVGRTGGAAE